MKVLSTFLTLIITLSLALGQSSDSLEDNTFELTAGLYSFELTPKRVGRYVNPGLSLAGLINKGKVSWGIGTDIVPSIFSNSESTFSTSMVTFKGIYERELITWDKANIYAGMAGGIMSLNNSVGGQVGPYIGFEKWFTKSSGIKVSASYNRLDKSLNTDTNNLYTVNVGYMHRFLVNKYEIPNPVLDSMTSDSLIVIDTIEIPEIILDESSDSVGMMTDVTQSEWDVSSDVVMLGVMTDTVYFGFDSDRLTDESMKKIYDMIDFKIVKDVYIEGHTDSTGPAEYNEKLAQRRANSVEDYIGHTSSYAVGMTENDAPHSNNTLQNRRKNRCAIIQITYQI